MKQENMTVVFQRLLAPKIYELCLRGELVQEMRSPGQFLHLKAPRTDLLLRRPISLAKISPAEGTCTIIYRVEGAGTEALSHLQSGDLIDVMGPLGHGFPLEDVSAGDTALIIGGGIGVPPLYELSCQLKRKGVQVVHVLGFTQKEVCYYETEFAENGQTFITTDDGSYGVKGHVGVVLADLLPDFSPTAVYACGSTGLLKTVETFFHDHPHTYLSLEERMACGMGACYACVCHVRGDDTQIESKRICQDGPVFALGEVEL